MIEFKNNFLFLHTPETTMAVDLRAENAILAYYGPRIPSEDGVFIRLKYDPDDWRHRSFFPFMLSGNGRGEFKRGAVLIRNTDGSFSSDFRVKNAELCACPRFSDMPSAHSLAQTVKITYADIGGAEIEQYLSVCDDCDVIVSQIKLVNEGKAPIFVHRLASLQLDLYERGYTIVSYAGQWAAERQAETLTLNAGTFVNASAEGASSARFNPAIALNSPNGEDWYGFNLLWSGDHKTSVECQENNTTRVLTGLNDENFCVEVKPYGSFVCPQACFVYAKEFYGITENMHAFVKKHIVRKSFGVREREILINSWESFYFDYDQEKLLALAKKAASLGLEMFVVDDGWFLGRNDDKGGLGDWIADPGKFPDGIGSFAEKVRALGLKFGIWIEPEMVSENSELFRAHPEWAMRVPLRPPVRMRRQLMLDLAREEVVNDRLDALRALFAECRPNYVKWDFNRFATDVPMINAQSIGGYDYLYQKGLYKLLSELQAEFPDTLFESCASGGARFDLGMLCYSEQIWTSDNTDARDRLKIQAGTAEFYPQSVMACHVSASPNHQTGNKTSLEDRFNVACGGISGYELNLLSLSAEECAAIAEQILFYKEYRSLLQFGKYYPIEERQEHIAGWCIVSEDKKRAVAMLAVTEKKSRYTAPYRYRLKGLREDYVYRVSARRQNNSAEFIPFCASGALLNNGKIMLGDFFAVSDRSENSNSVASRIFVLERQI